MKKTILFFGLIISSSAFAANCPDFSGTFASTQDQQFQREIIWKQTDCSEITFQEKIIKNGSVVLETPTTVKTDGVLRRPCTNCLEGSYTFDSHSLTTLDIGASGDGNCNEKHVYTLDNQGNIVDDWADICPQVTYSHKDIQYKQH